MASQITITSMANLTFLGLGAQKAGSTWLHRALSLHPDIGMTTQKELHYWDRQVPTEESVARYLALFDNLRGHARGEITPSYAILPADRIATIHSHLPDLRFIYVLRNPIERAWSQAKMELARHQRDKGRLPENLDLWLQKHFESPQSFARGDYATCMRNWYQRYPRDRMLVALYEEMRIDPRLFLRSCSVHLGVDPEFYESLLQIEIERRVMPEQEILKLRPLEMPDSPPQQLLELLNQILR